MTGKVYFIGAGPGDPDLITVKGRKIVERADCVVYAGSLVPGEVVACARPGAVVRDSSGMTLDQTLALLKETALAGGTAARVHTGDPSLYGTVQEQIRPLMAQGIDCEIVPGVSAAFAAAARAGVSFTAPEATQSLVVTRLAGRTPVPEAESLRRLAAHGSSMAVYLSASMAGQLQEELLAAGLEADTPVVVAHKVGHPDERMVSTTASDVARAVKENGITRQAVFLVLPALVGAESVSRLYDPDFAHGFRQTRQKPRGLAVFALTARGAATGRRIARALGGSLHTPARLAREFDAVPFRRLGPAVEKAFRTRAGLVFVAAAGVAVRCLAPLVRSKTTDPAVVVLDQDGRHAVSLLSGHLGGANALAEKVAGATGGLAVVTTATDTAGAPAMEMLARDSGLALGRLSALPGVNAALAEHRPVPLYDPLGRVEADEHFTPATPGEILNAGFGVRVDYRLRPAVPGVLDLFPKILAVGVGCRRGAPAGEISRAISEVLGSAGLDVRSVAALASIDVKRGEPGLLRTARDLGVECVFFDAKELAAMDAPNPSDMVREKVGTGSVCEAAALALARTDALAVEKTRRGPVTVAAAVMAWEK